MTNDDLLYRHRLLLFAKVTEMGVSRACREVGYHRSWYYRWKPLVERHGLEILRPHERRPPRMPNQLPDWMERKVVAFALAWPGLGPRRIAAQLARAADGMQISPSGVLKVLHRNGLGTRLRRLSLVSGYAAPPEPERPRREEKLHLEAEQPGDLVQFDCFHIGRLTGTEGRIWQYTAIDVASSYVWPRSTEPISTDNASEFRSESSGKRSPSWASTTDSSGLVARRPMAARNGSNTPSSRSAGDPPSLALWCPSTPPYAATSIAT